MSLRFPTSHALLTTNCPSPVPFLTTCPLALQGLTSARVSRAGTPTSLRSTQSISVLQIPSQRQASGRVSPPGTLRRSVSQFLDVQDHKALVDSALWEAILGHGSGLVSVPHGEGQRIENAANLGGRKN